MLRKKPSKSDKITYWTESQFKQLQAAPPGKLYSKGPLPWRLLAYMLKISPQVSGIRTAIRKRLMDQSRIDAGDRQLDTMLLTLHDRGFVTLDPVPPAREERQNLESPYRAELAGATPQLDNVLVFRSIHPLYGAFLLEHLGIANREERLQAFESGLEIARTVLRYVRVPFPDQMPPGPLATTRLDPELVQRGLIAAPKPPGEEDEEDDDDWERPPTLADKLQLKFEVEHPDVHDFNTLSVWAAGEVLLGFAGNFNLFVRTRDLVKQEGIIFRHILRLILLLGEFLLVTPKDVTPEDWQAELRELIARLTATCREVDPTSTDETIQKAHAADLVEGEHPPPPLDVAAAAAPASELPPEEESSMFGAGIFDDDSPEN
jgi:hypothetical protein